MLKAWQEYKIIPDFIFSSSVGALNACLLVQNELDKLEQLWLNIKTKDVYKFHFWVIPQLIISRNYVFDSKPLKQLIEKYVDYEKLKASKVKFYVTATNIIDWTTESYSPQDLNEEDFKTYLLASASPPLAFPPVWFKDKAYVDAGLINNFNISNAVKAGADLIVIMTPTVREETQLNNAVDMFNLLASVPEYSYLDRELSYIDKINELQASFPDEVVREIKHVLIRPPKPTGIDLLNFDLGSTEKRKSLIKEGYNLARNILCKDFFNDHLNYKV